MQRQVVLALVVIVALAVALSEPDIRAQTAEPRTLDDPEAYAVYAALLPGEWAIRNARAKRLVFQKETAVTSGCAPTGEALQTDWKPTVDNFWAENARSHLLSEGFPLGIPYVAVASEEIRALFGNRLGWDLFYQRFPDSGGYIVVSAVGFDAGKRRAMVQLSSSYGMLGAYRRFYFLTRTDSAWRETKIPGVSACIVMS